MDDDVSERRATRMLVATILIAWLLWMSVTEQFNDAVLVFLATGH